MSTFIGAGIEELRDEISMGGVELDSVESGVVQDFTRLDETGNNSLDLFCRQFPWRI